MPRRLVILYAGFWGRATRWCGFGGVWWGFLGWVVVVLPCGGWVVVGGIFFEVFLVGLCGVGFCGGGYWWGPHILPVSGLQ